MTQEKVKNDLRQAQTLVPLTEPPRIKFLFLLPPSPPKSLHVQLVFHSRFQDSLVLHIWSLSKITFVSVNDAYLAFKFKHSNLQV